MEDHAVEKTMQGRWEKGKSKEFLEADKLAKDKKEELEKAKHQLDKLDVSEGPSHKKTKVTTFGNDMITNHSHTHTRLFMTRPGFMVGLQRAFTSWFKPWKRTPF
jgi:hypothetical protein